MVNQLATGDATGIIKYAPQPNQTASFEMAIYSPAAEAALEAACTLADLLDREVTQAEMISAALESVALYLDHDCQQLMAIAKDILETAKAIQDPHFYD